MIKQIRKVAVLGAGVMGSGIAAHLANAGVPSLLLDIVPPNPKAGEDTTSRSYRDRFAAGALQKLLKTRPAALLTPRDLSLIEVGNFDDDLGRVAECDWIVEVVVENLAIKQALFERIEAVRRPGTLITSNTSGLSIEGMIEGRSEDFQRHFLVTHFFNPVRYMKLLELVPASTTDPKAMALLSRFGEEVLGKGIVYGKDTTNFIANRIGVYGMMKTIQAMEAGGYTVEEVDKVFGPATGRPTSAVFRTADLVGLDTFVHVARNCYDTLVEDEERDVFLMPAFVAQMLEKGWLGQKSGQGFYKKGQDAQGKPAILSLDLATMDYSEQGQVRFASLDAARKIQDVGERVKKVVFFDAAAGDAKVAGEGVEPDRASQLARAVTLATLAYSAGRMGEIADDVVNIDRGMRWGFNWELGPFETWDALGVKDAIVAMTKAGLKVADWVIEMVERGCGSFYSQGEGGEALYYDVAQKGYRPVPRSERDLSLGYLKQTRGVSKVAGNISASLWDTGEGILGLEFHSALNAKLNPIDDDIVAMMEKAVEELEANFDGLVIYQDSENFSAGANLLLLYMNAVQGNWGEISKLITRFQSANQAMTYSSKPVVAAPSGLTLGGGAEVVMGANAVQAFAELYMGLVEVGVGLIPGGAGNLNMLRNWYGPVAEDNDFDPLPYLKKIFMIIGMGEVAASAELARERGFLRAGDGVTLNRDHLLFAARQKALGMARAGFRPPRPINYRLPGRSGAATIDMMLYSMEQQHQISAHDRLVGAKLASVLTGGDTSTTTTVSEARLLELEREAFLSLCGEPRTQERIQYMLKNNKPLRN